MVRPLDPGDDRRAEFLAGVPALPVQWNARSAALGEGGLVDRSSAPHAGPTQTAGAVVARIETLRREKKRSARLIAGELTGDGISISRATVGRRLARLGLTRRRDLDPDGENNRTSGMITARYPGHMIHVDVKKVGRIPDGVGWRVHGRGSDCPSPCRTRARGGPALSSDGRLQDRRTERMADAQRQLHVGLPAVDRAADRLLRLAHPVLD
ncbi:MAG: Integrase catalytic region, partial [Nocardioides sp.]|nr:Integrase catalytic region [Nocardioides sp.]